MEREAKKDKGFYYQFFNESDTAMAVLNSEGMILTANKNFENLFESLSQSGENTGPESGGGSSLHKSIRDILQSPGSQDFWPSLIPIIAGERNYIVFQCSFNFRRNGEDIPHWFNAHAWRIEAASLAHGDTLLQKWLIGLVLEDYTLVRQEEKKLLLGKESAEKAMEAKDQFLANMSHEIRTPIQTIIGMVELLQETHLDHEQSEYSRQVKFSAEVLLTLINDILDFSKIEAGKMELEHIDFDLEQIVEQAVEMIALEAHKKELYIATSIPLETNIIIRGDPSRFRQVVINLVKNAVKFTKEGGVTVSLKLTSLADKEALRVSVADTGIGVNEETRPKLFSTFMQGDVSTTRRFGGTGLGLAISHNLVNLMKGNIEMVPNEGGGSIFRFDIPLERSGKKPPPLPPPERDGKLRILVVDDRVQERKIIESCLRDLGYTDISQAESGKAALKMMKTASAKGNAYQLCFLDMIMPVMDGWRLAAEIHNDSEIKQPELVLMVPHGLMGAETKMTLLKWFKAYINKPIKRRSLAETITTVLNEPQELEDASLLEEQTDSERPGQHSTDIPVLQEESEGPAAYGWRDIGSRPGLYKASTAIRAKNKLPVLIAEDHPVNQKLFSMIMDKLGYSSILADDGQDALEKIAAHKVALVFMDIQMPRMNGYEASENLRKRGFKKPIIAVTASALSDEREHCLRAGIDDVLVKPFKRADIAQMLEKWLNSSRDTPNPPPIPVEEPDIIPSPNIEPESGNAAIPAKGPEIVTSVQPDQNAVFDNEAVLDTFLDNREMVATLLPRFIERTQVQLNNIPDLQKAGNLEECRIEAHTIKGAAFTMSGTELGKAAARLELAYKNNVENEFETAYTLVKEAFDRFKEKAEEFLRSRN